MREVAVARGQSAAVIYDDELPVTVLKACEGDDAIGSCCDGSAVIGCDVLACVELGRVAAERIAAVAEAIGQSTINGPGRGRHCTRADECFISAELLFEMPGLVFDGSCFIKRNEWATRAIQNDWLIVINARHPFESPRSVFDSVNTMVQLFELLSLLRILRA